MPAQQFTLMPGAVLQLSSHAENGEVCAWAEDGHVLDDDVCFNGKDICVECCAKSGGCCYDAEVDGPTPEWERGDSYIVVCEDMSTDHGPDGRGE